MVVVGTGEIGTRFLKDDWPNEDGLTAGTTKTHDRQVNLVAEEKSNVMSYDRKGI